MKSERPGSNTDCDMEMKPASMEKVGDTRKEKERKIVSELLRLISSNKNFMLGVSANGKLGSPFWNDENIGTLGQSAYIFDSDSQLFKRVDYPKAGSTLPDPMVYSSDPKLGPRDLSTVNQPLFRVYNQILTNRDQIMCFEGWVNVSSVTGDALTTDCRGPHVFSGDLFIRNCPEAVTAASEELFEVIKTVKIVPESKAIFWKFLVAAFERYTPGWWNLVKQGWQKQPENKDKDIADFFDKI